MVSLIEDRLFPRLIEATDLSPNGWPNCWLWPGAKTAGYGSIAKGYKQGRALVHRVVWEYVVGVIPPGLELDHLCRRRACCNPAHLEPVTHRENLRRADLAGFAKLNSEKTHCSSGHPLSGTNLRIERNGSRRCRACWCVTRRRYRATKAARLGSWQGM